MKSILAAALGVFAVATNILAQPRTCTLDGPRSVYLVVQRVNPIDVDLDGHVDLAGVGSSYDSVAIAYGRGDGTFEPYVTVYSPVNYGYQRAIPVLADVNGDGRADIVASRVTDIPSMASEIVILYNEGQRRFSAPRVIASGTFLFPFMVADFTNDGRLDVIAWKHDGPSTLIERVDSSKPVQRPTNDFTSLESSFVTGDFDDDGDVDIVASDKNFKKLTIARGDGKGLFSPPEAFADSAGVTVADANGDGKPDLVVANWRSKKVSIYETPLSAVPTMQLDTSGVPRMATVADFDRDGIADVVTFENPDVDSSLAYAAIYIGDRNGGFHERDQWRLGRTGRVEIASGDFDENGVPDVVAATEWSFAAARGRGDGTLVQASDVATLMDMQELELAADFDGDGIDEIVAATRDWRQTVVGWADGQGEYELEVIAPYGSRAAAADLDPSPGKELILASLDGVTVYARTGRAWLPVAAYKTADAVTSLAATDKAVFAVTEGNVKSVQSFTSHASSTVVSSIEATWFAKIAVGDFDGDAIDDLMVLRSGRGPDNFHIHEPKDDGSLAFRRGRADGTFGAEERVLSNRAYGNLLRGDFDGDGDLDLAVYVYTWPSGTYLLLNDGHGRFTEKLAQALGYPTVAGDFNGDGIDDLARHLGGGHVQVLYGTRSGMMRDEDQFFLGRSSLLAARRSRSGPLSVLANGTALDPRCPPGPRRRGVRH